MPLGGVRRHASGPLAAQRRGGPHSMRLSLKHCERLGGFSDELGVCFDRQLELDAGTNGVVGPVKQHGTPRLRKVLIGRLARSVPMAVVVDDEHAAPG